MNINLIVGRCKDAFVLNGFDDYEISIYKHLSKKVVFNTIFVPSICSSLKVIPKMELSKTSTLKHFVRPGLAYILNFTNPANSIVTCHDVTPLFLNYFSLKSRLWFKFSMKGMVKADRIIADSKSTKKDILKHLKYPEDKISVVHLGVNHNRYKVYKNADEIRIAIKDKYKIDDREKVILYVGAEQPRKNLDTLIKAFYMLKKKMPKTKLIKVGHPYWGGGREKLLNLIKTRNLQNDVIFANFVREDELPLFYNAADIFVFPSYYEGFGQPLVEAMACGCPLITTNTSSMPEIVGDAAIKLKNPFDVDLLARKMEDVLNDDGLSEDLIIKGLNQAKKFSWRKYANDIYEVYKEVGNGK